MSELVHAREKTEGERDRCAFCHDVLHEDADAGSIRAECVACGTAHHAACFVENGGCAVMGCRANWVRRAGQLLVPVSLGANHTVKRVVFQRYFVKVVPKPSIDARAKDWLRSIYEPDVSALESLLGREMSELRRSW